MFFDPKPLKGHFVGTVLTPFVTSKNEAQRDKIARRNKNYFLNCLPQIIFVTAFRHYSGFVQNMEVYYQLAGTLGDGHVDRASIPQGCPFSMVLVALLMRPWVSLMRECGVKPRTLADDLLFMAEGRGMEGKRSRRWKRRETFSVTLA